eukprot:CAMPEP_0184384024 /NCGR_PEP_ID=MMETSP0007-20130409/7600_1 /TAXON_ID=97485 /ORGANISM="Prymnesium parvum, Strain Texoma1" /LENGTH=38 /DNA_ID= /DNA_START= /DNA_END= /DNA_ORIENTATION=
MQRRRRQDTFRNAVAPQAAASSARRAGPLRSCQPGASN